MIVGMLKIWNCKRCLHEWANRLDKKPVICPHCKSPYWDRERVRK